jgi:malonate-semialdehyde dehydrogenase (acetylating)/methylmalonate-semialdehyde dehydrogenase
MRSVAHFIDGQSHEGAGRSGDIFDPATGEVAARVSFADAAVLDEAIAVARSAQLTWASASLSTRTNVLFSLRQSVKDHADELAAILTSEHGKTTADARGELARGLENLEYACGLMEHLKGEFSSQVSEGVDVHSVREPLGVVAAITPFNFPAMVPLWMAANALASGNAVVLKPSEKDPSVSVRLAELFVQAGLPAGLFNVVHGDKSAVDHLLDHPGIDAVSFVGSTPVARYIFERASASGKRAQALGGAKNHMVVLNDADLDVAADAAVSAAFGSAGERCMAISVVVAVDSVADALIDRISSRMDALRVGPGNDPQSDFGPLISAEHRDRVASYLERAPIEGALVVRDGRDQTSRPGFFLGPSLIDRVRPGTSCYDDEIFGPVLSVVRVAHYAEAVSLINANRYGNGVAIFTSDGHSARNFTRDVNVGMIGVNVPIPVPVAAYSFGGWGDSLFGHAHIYGPEGFAFYTRAKVITTRWPQPSDSRVNLGFPLTR